MNNLNNLIVGEITRLKKYKILTVGIAVSFIWGIIIALSNKDEITLMMPMLMGMDATMMSIILLAASFYYEKQEGTIKAVLVAPVRLIDILISKVVAAITISLFSAFLVLAAGYFIHGIKINILLMIIYILIIVISHTAIGFLITLSKKDFGSMLGVYILYALIALVPSIFYSFGIIDKSKLVDYLLMISPSHAAQTLLDSLVKNVEAGIIVIGIIYLLIITISLYSLVIYKKFKKYVVEG